MKEKIRSLGMELLDYDACSQIWVKSWCVCLNSMRNQMLIAA